jgi:hypothetical protein
MAKHGSDRWRRLRELIAVDPGHFAAGSAVFDTWGLLAFEAEQLAGRSEAVGGLSEPRCVPGSRDCKRPVETGRRPASGEGDIE